MGVSTRGVKFKFSSGERVLCYEPDPTKAKVLYESKVLELFVGRDDNGRKIAEYLIHFCGWNSSWDRCVREDFILPYNEENIDLQKKLAQEADLTLKGKRKSKVPPLIKEVTKKQNAENANDNSLTPESPKSSSDSDSSEDETEKEVVINIPEDLKKQLEIDWKNITKKNKLVKLPCEPNVVAILESFVKHLAAKLLCVSPPRNSKNGKQLMPDDVQNKLNLCKEAMDGIRVYFDFTLPYLLLYHQEKEQFYTDGQTATPIDCSNMELFQTTESEVMKEELSLKEEISVNMDTTPEVPSPSKKRVLSKTESSVPAKLPIRNSKGRSNLQNQRVVQTLQTTKKNGPNVTLEIPSPQKFKKATRGKSKVLITRNLRSSDKNKHSLASEDISMNENQSPASEMKSPLSSDGVPKSPNSLSSVAPSSPPPVVEARVTRKSAQQNMSPPQTFASLPHTSRSSTIEKSDSIVSSSSRSLDKVDHTILPSSHLSDKIEHAIPSTSRLSEKMDFSIPSTSHWSADDHTLPSTSSESPWQHFPPSLSLTSNCITSSNSSSHSTFSNQQLGQKYQLIKNAGLLQEILAWRLLPSHLHELKPPEPSLIYGAQHLLRLFVKLPELMSRMKISNRKLQPLLSILEKFLIYLSDQKDVLFVPSAYIDSCDDLHDGNQAAVK